MSTVMKAPVPQRGSDQLHRDRLTVIVVLSIMIAVIALVIWLASMAGVPVEPIDTWPLMP